MTFDFDVSMGSLDSAEVCELVGLFLLSKLERFIPKDQIGLYRDDGLAVVELPGTVSRKESFWDHGGAGHICGTSLYIAYLRSLGPPRR